MTSKILSINDVFPSRPDTLQSEALGQPFRFIPNDVKDATIFARNGKRREMGYYCVSKEGNKFFLRLQGVSTYFTIAFDDGFNPNEIQEVADDFGVKIDIVPFKGYWFKGFKNKRLFHHVNFTNSIDRKKVLNVFKNTIWCDSPDIYGLRNILGLTSTKLKNKVGENQYYGIRFDDFKDTITLYKCLSYMKIFNEYSQDDLSDAVNYITYKKNDKYVNLAEIKTHRTKIADAKNKDAKNKARETACALIDNFELKSALYKLFIILNQPNDFDSTIQDLLSISFNVIDAYFIGNDDTSHLYRVTGRDHNMNTANWNEVVDYKIVNDPDYYVPVIVANINKIEPVEESATDKSINMTWDIETRPLSMETNPDPKNFKDKIFAICCTFHHINNPKPFCKVGIIWKKCSPTDCLDYLITCSSEQEVIIALTKLVKTMRPDFMSDFNGCLFDQPFVVERIKLYKLTKHLAGMSCEKPSYRFQKDPSNISEYYSKRMVKMEAGFNNQVDLLDIPGIIPIDVRIVFRKIYKTADETSLNFFLRDNKLELKEDLPYKKMFAIWDKGDPDELPEILKYCVIDAQRCQELLVKRNIINNDRAKATMSGDALYGCIHYADGVKVRNVLIKLNTTGYLAELGITFKYPVVFACAYSHNEKGGYKGATVLQPEAGYYEIPITALDYASLYPNCAIDKNISPDRKITDKALKERMEKKGHRFYEAEPGVWFIQHNTDISKMGVFSRSLSILFDARVKLKNQLAVTAGCLEFLTNGISTGDYSKQEDFEADLSPKILKFVEQHKLGKLDEKGMAAYQACIDVLQYETTQLDAKQLAAKIFMNTFYGESGNASSPLYDKHISATITSIGRDMLLFAKTHMENKSWKVIYGDTDSVYCLTPLHLIQDIIDDWEKSKKLIAEGKSEKAVYINKKAYWEALVVRTIKVSKSAAKELNTAIAEYSNGQTYLNMAYEEVLMPSLFVRRKNYGGLAHQKLPMFNAGQLQVFVRGFRFKKRGVSNFCKIITKNMAYNKFFDPESTLEGEQVPWHIVHELMKIIFKQKWEMNDFAKTYTYKGPSRGGTATDIVKSNTEKYGITVEPGDKYQAVVVTGIEKYDIRGRKNKLKVSDITVLLDIAKKENMKIDIMYYMQKEVKNLFGQYLSVYPCFRKPTEYFVELIKERAKNGKLKKDFDIEVSTAESDYAGSMANEYVEYLLNKYSDQSQITHDVPKKAYKTAQLFFKSKKVGVLETKANIRKEVNYAELFKKDLPKLKVKLLELNAKCLEELNDLNKNPVDDKIIQQTIEEVTTDIRNAIKLCTYSDDAHRIINSYELPKKYRQLSASITRREELRITMEQIGKMLIMVNKKLDIGNEKIKVISKGMNLS